MRVIRSYVLAALAALPSCVSEPEAPPYQPMCELDEDCAGGTSTRCHDGLCVGPAFLPFAAELRPPAERTDLAVSEIPELEVNQDGQVLNVRFADAVWLRGRIVLESSEDLSVAARLVFTRPSRIPGTPPYIVDTTATRNVPEGSFAFEVRLPRTIDGEKYLLTIFPDDGQIYDDSSPPALFAPPLRISSPLDADYEATIPLVGEGGFKQIHGFVLDATGTTPMPGMIVRAFGRFSPEGPLELASSSGITDAQGMFAILAPDDGEDEYEIEVAPGPGVDAPTLRRPGVIVPDPQGNVVITEMIDPILFPPFAVPSSYRIPVFGVTSSGTQEPAAGATLRLWTRLDTYSDDTAVYEVTAQVGLDGYANVALIPGSDRNREYLVDAIPVEGARVGAVWNTLIEVGPSPGTLAVLALPSRVYLTGRVLDAHGQPARDVAVKPQLSTLFTAPLDALQLQQVHALRWPLAYTDANGDWGLYVDAEVLALAPMYDLGFEPPFSSLNPRWNLDRIQLEPGAPTWGLGEFRLPEATYHWGTVVDPDGFEVPGAGLRVFLVPNDPICAMQIPGCEIPARQMAQAQSSERGEVTLVLPRGPPTTTAP